MRTQEQINEIVRLLLEEYPLADCTLDWRKDYELLFSVRLAAQCTDERVNKITPALFARFPTLEAFAEADVEEVEEYVREAAVKVYSAIGCKGLSRVDFFVTYEDNRVVFNEINTLPGFTSISMYPKLFAASGIPYSQLIDQLLELAMEACE